MLERRVVALVAVVVVVGAAIAFFLFAGDEAERRVEDPPGLAGSEVVDGNVARYFDDGEDVLLYKSGAALLERPVDGGREKKLAEIDAEEVYASPASPWVAYYPTASAKTDDVVLTLFQSETEETVELKGALGPSWSPDGSRLAYLAPTDRKACLSLSACGSALTVQVWDAAEQASVEVAGEGEWSAILGWSGSALLVQEGPEAQTITALSLEGAEEDTGVAVDEFLSASPDGRWLLVREEGGALFVPTGGGEGVPAAIPGFELTSGVWTHDSQQVLGVASPTSTGGGKGKKQPDDLPQLVTFSVDAPLPQFFEESYGAFGDVMWGPGNDYVGFGRRAGDNVPEFVYCPVGEGDCVSLIAYGEGTLPLRLQ